MRYFCLFILTVFAAAQTSPGSGSIAGSIADGNGAAVSGAAVQIKNLQTNAVTKTSSDAAGKYSITALPAGNYGITVTAARLTTFHSANLTVESGKTNALEIRMAFDTQLGTLGEDRFATAADILLHKPPSGPTPRMKDEKPDLSGVWWSPRTIDGGNPQFLPAAEAIAKQRRDDNRKDNPQSHCLPSATTRLGPLFQLVQSRDSMVIISDDDSPGFHQVYLDGRSHPADPNPAWYGHNVGKWDGDTLVVDRIGFNERVYLDQDLHPHSDHLHIVERYRRPDLGHLEMDITVEDPDVLAKPFTMKRVADLAQGYEIYEFICPENERDALHLVGK